MADAAGSKARDGNWRTASDHSLIHALQDTTFCRAANGELFMRTVTHGVVHKVLSKFQEKTHRAVATERSDGLMLPYIACVANESLSLI